MTTRDIIFIGAGTLIPLIIIIIQFIIYGNKLKALNLSKKIVDTSVIIDGRIGDICRAGFIEGTLIIPRFVLQELQHIADSSDHLKRNKGRRGMDVLNSLKKYDSVTIQIVENEYRDIKEVDEKLVALAKDLGAKVITNDYNLNKIAEIQGVKILNINDLSNSIKPIFLPGERINVKIMKEGKEKDQGVAYLTDGTMIVVDNSRRMMGKRIDVTVTNVLQTDAGRMIFARFENRHEQQRGHGNGGRDRKEVQRPDA